MKVLELFSGTGSVGKVCKELGYEVVSLDLKGADINTNILDWDYTQFNVGEFDIIWASPPCDTFSALRRTWLGRKLKCHNGQVCTLELLQKDIDEMGVPILRKAEEIIDYFKPKLWFIENPQTGRMKEYIHKPHYDVDYCKYADWGYKKRTRIWTNQTNFEPKLCKNDCNNLLINGRTHKCNFGGNKMIMDGDKIVKVNSLEKKEKYKEYENIQPCIGGGQSRNKRYRIPPQLIRELLWAPAGVTGASP